MTVASLKHQIENVPDHFRVDLYINWEDKAVPFHLIKVDPQEKTVTLIVNTLVAWSSPHRN